MKLLLDQKLSPTLVNALADLYPDSAHVQLVGLDRASDAEVWSFAKEKGHTIVSKDSDFNERVMLYGAPPKVLWIRRGNCDTKRIEMILRRAHPEALKLQASESEGLLELF